MDKLIGQWVDVELISKIEKAGYVVSAPTYRDEIKARFVSSITAAGCTVCGSTSHTATQCLWN